MAREVFLPDFEADWKWSRLINPHTLDVCQECQNWAASFKAFTPRAQEAFNKCSFPLLAGLCYPYLTCDQLKSSCDLMNLFFIFDEHSDKSAVSEVNEQVRVILDAIQHDDIPRPDNEWVGGAVARQFWIRARKVSTQTFQKKFFEACKDYLHGTAEQAEDRCDSRIRDISTYFDVRRRTVGAYPSFAILEMGMDLPNEVADDPVIRGLEMLAVDMCIIINDVLSYNKEQACGDDQHNLVTIVMRAKDMEVQSAINWAGKKYADMATEFNRLYLKTPRWGGPLDRDVQCYVDGIGQWISGNIHWSYESERYFGKGGLEVRKTRKVQLLPKRKLDGIGPVVVDETLL